MTRKRSGITVRVCISLLGMLFAADHMAAQSGTTAPSTEQQKAEREYADMLGRVQQGDMTVDFRAFRIAGALKSGPHASKLETEERAAFRNIMASGDWTGALDSAKRALERNYASPIAQYDAMAAYQALGKTAEAAAHEKILNALLDSIRQSGDGKSPETAYFVVTVQEEYMFLNRVLSVRATSQDWVRKDGHFYDRLAALDSSANRVGYLWFNADFDARSDPVAIAAVKDGVLATTTATRPEFQTALTGRVVWNGLPLPSARVLLAHRDSVSAPASARTVTDSDGVFWIQDPPGGSLMIWISAPSSDYADLTGHPVTIIAGHPKNVGDLPINKKLHLLSPADRATISTTTPTLQWAPFPGSARYDVYVFNDAMPQRLLLQSATDAQMTVPHPLPSGQLLRWGVTAYNSSGQQIAGSWWHFTVASPNSAPNTAPDPHEPAATTRQGTEEFWRDEEPSDWSGGQTKEFLTKSPWVRYFGGLQVQSDACISGPQGCRFPTYPVGSLTIRWESAPLVRDALKRIESQEYNDALAGFSKDYYVIAVVRKWPDASPMSQTRLSGHWSPEQEEELRNAMARQPKGRGMLDPPLPMLIGNEEARRAFSVSRLSRPGYEAISPVRVESAGKARDTVDLLLFPRSLALESGIGDVEITTTLLLGNRGPLPFRASFSSKELGGRL